MNLTFMRPLLLASLCAGLFTLSGCDDKDDTMGGPSTGSHDHGSHDHGSHDHGTHHPVPNPCLHETRAQSFAPGLESMGQQHKITIMDAIPRQPIIQHTNAWVIKLETLQGGLPVDGATFPTFSPRMPDHGHGLPSGFKVAVVPDPALGPGMYRVSNLGFSMGGYWETEVHVQGTAADGTAWTDMVQIKTCINP